jgi:hypothetical protein
MRQDGKQIYATYPEYHAKIAAMLVDTDAMDNVIYIPVDMPQ